MWNRLKSLDRIRLAQRVPPKLHALLFQGLGAAQETMDGVYKLSSTERIQLLEKDLAEKLSELKADLEEQELLLPGTANWTFRWGFWDFTSHSHPTCSVCPAPFSFKNS